MNTISKTVEHTLYDLDVQEVIEVTEEVITGLQIQRRSNEVCKEDPSQFYSWSTLIWCDPLEHRPSGLQEITTLDGFTDQDDDIMDIDLTPCHRVIEFEHQAGC